MILKWNNGQKREPNIRKRALNIRRGVHPHHTHPPPPAPRYATGLCLSVKILQGERKKCSDINRPTRRDIGNFNTHPERIFHSAYKENKLYFILGDFNLNCLNYDKSLDIKKFYDSGNSQNCPFN